MGGRLSKRRGAGWGGFFGLALALGGCGSEPAGSSTGDERGTTVSSSGSVEPGSTTAVDGEGGSTATQGMGGDSSGALDTATGTTSGSDSSGAPPVTFDVGGGPKGCPSGGKIDESYIWIANSSEGTVSKIDTRELEEVGRYAVRPDGGGNPSRTSVNGANDAVVLSRDGGLTKFYGSPSRCQDTNGTPGIQTSPGGPGTTQAWDDEECRAWHTPLNYLNMRAVAWTSGVLDPETCEVVGSMVWASGNNDTSDSADVLLIDGEDGSITETIELPDDLPLPLGHGAYGAAVDADNNLWIVQLYNNRLLRVDRNTFEIDWWDEPEHTYGMTIDTDGSIWTCNRHLGRFDPITETWDVALIEDWQGFFGHAGGCMSDGNGIIWKSMDDRLLAVETATMNVVDTITLPEGMLWGVAVDYDGYVWAIPRSGSTAYRVDPATHQIESVGGLVGAYTYSDMTGFLLGSVTGPVG
ncbi:MAG: hypothetical protein AAF799_47405 [Myxococcota bacterium]